LKRFLLCNTFTGSYTVEHVSLKPFPTIFTFFLTICTIFTLSSRPIEIRQHNNNIIYTDTKYIHQRVTTTTIASVIAYSYTHRHTRRTLWHFKHM